MRWLFRPIATLLVAPILVEIVALYIRATTSADAISWPAVAIELGRLYLAFTLPALVLMLMILLPADLLLRRSGFGLLTILVSPVLAVLVVLLLRQVTSDPHVAQWASAISIFLAYGLVWGLTIRDPWTVMAV